MADRRHDARHPMQVGTVVSLAFLAAVQLAFGPGSRVVLAMAGWAQALFAAMLLGGGLLALLSTQGVGRGYAVVELVGLQLCTIALFFYSTNIPESAGVLSLAPFFGLFGAACAWRSGVVWRWLRRKKRDG
ncbi:hypothetical protein ACXYX3_17560 [Mycobacterium sp. C3-094]